METEVPTEKQHPTEVAAKETEKICPGNNQQKNNHNPISQERRQIERNMSFMRDQCMDISPIGIGFFSPGTELSNFYLCSIIFDGQIYKSAEHAYQGEHAKFAKRPDIFKAILDTPHAALAKSFGRRIGKDPEWDKIKGDKMKAVLRCKFTQNERLRDYLISTSPFNLIETTKDEFWASNCNLRSLAFKNGTWNGQNMLGLLLVNLREDLIRIQKCLTV